MKVISWNIRGLNHPHKHDLLSNSVRDHKLDICLVQEMKMFGSKVKKLKLAIFGDCGVHCVDGDGASGGITTLWNLILLCGKVVLSSPNHIATRYFNLKDGSSWIISNIYAPNGRSTRKSLWSSICLAKTLFPNEKWILLGDFNTPLSNLEKFGGIPIYIDSRQDLADMINSLSLLDLDLIGAKFT